MEQTVTKSEMEKYFLAMLKSRVQDIIEEYIDEKEVRLKEFALVERIVNVESELKSLREMSEVKFDALQREMSTISKAMDDRFHASEKRVETIANRFEIVDKKFEIVNKRFDDVDKKFEIVDKRFDPQQSEMNSRFEALQREMNSRFEAMNSQFKTTQWMITLIGIPAIVFAITWVLEAVS